MKNNFLLPGLFLSFAIIISALIFSNAWQKHLNANQTLSVVGSAKMEFTSDLGYLRGSIAASSATASGAFSALNAQKPALFAYFNDQGFVKNKVNFKPPVMSSTQEYDEKGRYTGKVLKYTYSQNFEVSSSDVKKIQDMSTTLPALIEKGVFVNVFQPSYIFTELSKLKVDVQALAAKDAMSRAKKIAESTGSDLGEIRKARMGVLQITPLNSTLVSDYGVNDTTSIEKEITAVVSASFSVQ